MLGKDGHIPDPPLSIQSMSAFRGSANQPLRQPRGQPIGGQFAAKSNPECDTELVEVTPPGEDDGPWSWDAIYDMLGADEANALFEESGGSLGRALAIAVRREAERCSSAADLQAVPQSAPQFTTVNPWHAAGVTDPEAISRMQERGLTPDDLASQDRDTRMAAHSAAGHMLFEGELLSNAYQLYRHEPSLSHGRTFHHPSQVYVGGVARQWHSLPATEQLAYIGGYARAIAHDGDQEHPPPDREEAASAGYVCGQNAVAAEKRIRAGNFEPGTSFRIVDPDANNRELVVVNPRYVPERGGYIAEVGDGQYRRYSNDEGSRLVPISPHARIFFEVDALGVG